MSSFIVLLICALILAAITIIFITYWMFCKERHRSERFQYDITGIRINNYKVAQEQEQQKKKDVTAAVFVLTRKKRTEDYSYSKRPDYPEGPVTRLEPNMDKLIDIVNDSPPSSETRKCVDFNLDPDVPYHSEV